MVLRGEGILSANYGRLLDFRDWAGWLLSDGDGLVLPMVPAGHEGQVDGGYVDE
jgi:hypothetical protein